MNTPHYQKRDNEGRYTFNGKWSRLCRCGHTLGVHSSGAPHDCLAGTGGPSDPNYTGVFCNCEKFSLTRRKSGVSK